MERLGTIIQRQLLKFRFDNLHMDSDIEFGSFVNKQIYMSFLKTFVLRIAVIERSQEKCIPSTFNPSSSAVSQVIYN